MACMPLVRKTGDASGLSPTSRLSMLTTAPSTLTLTVTSLRRARISRIMTSTSALRPASISPAYLSRYSVKATIDSG